MRTHLLFSKIRSRNYPPLNSRVKILALQHTGEQGILTRLRGLGRVQIKLDSGESINIDAKHIARVSPLVDTKGDDTQ